MIDFDYGVKLDSLKFENIEFYRKARNSDDIRKWCRQYDLISEQDQIAWFKRQNDDPKIKMYEIIRDNTVVGVCGLTDIDHINQRAEFSLYIMPEYHRRGFAKAGLKTLFKHGFNNLNLNCIWGETFDGNPAAKLFRDIGMTKEGYRRQYYFRQGEFIGCEIFSILRSQC